MLSDELFDDFLFDAWVEHICYQTGVSQHITGTTGSLTDWKIKDYTVFTRSEQDRDIIYTEKKWNNSEKLKAKQIQTHDVIQKTYLRSLGRESLLKVCQNLSTQLALRSFYP